MTLVADLFKEKKFPNWFSEHPIFKDVKKIKKVFPGIGLPNCEENAQLDKEGPAKESAKRLVADIRRCINTRIEALNKYIAARPEMSDERKAKGARCLELLKGMHSLLERKSAFIIENNGRLAIKLPSDVNIPNEERPVFRRNESLFRVVNKINEALHEGRFARVMRIEDFQSFKSFSAENIPNNGYKIVFSSDGINGAWDIATMSMRGVSSCQSWSGEYRHCTIGSVVDPFVGIIYLTSGAKFSDHGSKMIRRCIVRFVIDGKDNKPYLLLDYVYPNDDEKIIDKFKSFLKEKTGGKFEVFYAPKMGTDKLKDTYLPLTELRKRLRETNRDGDSDPIDDLDSISSYQDVKITDKISGHKNDKHAKLYEKNTNKKINKFLTEFNKIFSDSIKNSNPENFSDSENAVLGKLRGDKKKRNYYDLNYSYVIPVFSNMLGKEIVKSVNKENFTSSDLFIRRVYISYFNNKQNLLNNIKSKLAKEINGQLQLKDKEKITANSAVSIMNKILANADTALKSTLKEMVSGRKKYKAMSLPD